MSFLLLITALNGGAPDPDLATLLFLFVYFPLLLNFLLVGMGVSLIEWIKLRRQFPEQMREFSKNRKQFPHTFSKTQKILGVTAIAWFLLCRLLIALTHYL